MKLNLGVIDVLEPEGGTSYSVGVDLEKRYGLFSMFANAHEKDIADAIAKDAVDGLEAIMRGESVDIKTVFAESGEEITDQLHNFITSQEVERVATQYGEYGIPTQAALEGLSLRTSTGKAIGKARKGMKTKVVKGARRPSFIYSGIFEHSLKAWVE
jgi:hypothetical protein